MVMRARNVLATLLIATLAAAGAYFARPHLDRWRAAPVETGAQAAATYQCSMHPQIVSDRPGTCPICQMQLQRVDVSGAATPDRRPLFYRHPMRPDVTSPEPAKDEMGMDYVPVYAEEEAIDATIIAGRSAFTLSPERQHLIGLTRAPVEDRRLDSEIRAVGTVAYDPALYQAIIEYRQALDARRALGDDAMFEARQGAAAIARAAALRLRQLGLSEAQVRDLSAGGRSPIDLLLPDQHAWVYAQVYEYEMGAVRAGQTATITLPSQPARSYTGRVVAVDPILDAATRTARVRIHVPTPDASLRPQAFVRATIHVPSDEVLAVPADAVLPSGHQQIVFVVSGPGAFAPRTVQLGRQAGGYYEVLDGLRAGEEVVTSANFLIDSESRFRAALAAFSKKAAEGAAPSAPGRGGGASAAPTERRPPDGHQH
jgi:multidrug efflux pump subunit AcrA (membrane-fusion protein)